MSYFTSKYLLAAKELAAKDWSHPSVIKQARHMAHAGALVEDIRRQLWPDVQWHAAYRRLRKFNIDTRPPRAHTGATTTLGVPTIGFDARPYKPKARRRYF